MKYPIRRWKMSLRKVEFSRNPRRCYWNLSSGSVSPLAHISDAFPARPGQQTAAGRLRHGQKRHHPHRDQQTLCLRSGTKSHCGNISGVLRLSDRWGGGVSSISNEISEGKNCKKILLPSPFILFFIIFLCVLRTKIISQSAVSSQFLFHRLK